MKKVFITAFIMSAFAFGSASNANTCEEISTYKTSLVDFYALQNWYATTGVTKNSIGTNYSINIRIKGRQLLGGCVSILEVQVSNGGSWSSARYSKVIGEDCTYYVNVEGKSYYFTI